MNSNTQCDVLLVTVTDVETEALLETVKRRTGRDYKTEPGKQKTYFDLGMIGGARVFAVRSEMGSDTLGGSLLTVKDAITEVKPSAVIMVGIAFGIDPKKQKVGEVLVAKQLQAYDLQRVGTAGTGSVKIILRGDKPHCSEKLLDRFRTTRLRWKKAEVQFGLVLSGEKLVDNIDFRDQLLSLSEEAIGGEMEGGGLYAASQQSKVDWILVKAICDWADGKKEVGRKKKQKIAAQNSADFVIEMLASGLLAQRERKSQPVATEVAKISLRESAPLSVDRISIARLPTGGGELFGREAELQLLDDAWVDPNTNIVSFVAWGGVGKTALVNHWLKQRMARDDYRGAGRVYGWSFFSQGTTERAASADLFIDQALRWFGDKDPTAGSPWDKGERLARFLRQTRTLLVLDGLEPLQHPPGTQEGKLKDAAMQALLVELAAQQQGLCVISTREHIGDLIEFEDSTVIKRDLDYLSPQAGAQILCSFEVKGDDDELETASRELGGHAFSLTLLGSYLNEVFDGDIRKREEIENLFDDTRYGEKAQAMIAAYERWLGEGIELAILRLLGLFNSPASAASIAALREPPAILGLTEPLQHFKAREWNQAVSKLRRIKLLGEASPNEPGSLDAHPLVREYFKQQLERECANAWRDGNNRIYEQLKNTTKEFPDTVEEMSTLYSAVTHGCASGKYQNALDAIYISRIHRRNEYFSLRKLGAFGADLAALSNFFEARWQKPVTELNTFSKTFVLNQAGSDLRALGRLHEAIQPIQASLEGTTTEQSWMNAAISAENLSSLCLLIGDLQNARQFAEKGVALADQSEEISERRDNRAVLANTLNHAGLANEAAAIFHEAEQIQQQAHSDSPFLYSVHGFEYCDLLLDQGKIQEVKNRAFATLRLAQEQFGLLSNALDCLSLGRALLVEAQEMGATHSTEAEAFIQDSLDGLRKAGLIEYLPRGLLARAELHRFNRNYSRAERDLTEVQRIVTRSRMRLHLADYHLESALLRLAQDDNDGAREHWKTAKEMIDSMGYHRRDKEVEEIARQLL